MKIAINIASLSGGALVRERNILRALSKIDQENEYIVICQRNRVAKLPDLGPRFSFHPVTVGQGPLARLLWENLSLPRLVQASEAELLLFPLHMTNLHNVCRKVIVVRNAAPFCDYVIRSSNLYQKFRLLSLRWGTWVSTKRADHVVFISETTKNLVCARLRLNGVAMSVVPHGIPQGFSPRSSKEAAVVLEPYGIRQPYLLSVGNISAYKNTVELIEAYRLVSQDMKEVPPLYIVGDGTEQYYLEKVRTRITHFGLEEQIRLTGRVAHEDLPFFYSACKALVFTSTCENSPVTLIEAMACGAPIFSSNRASMPEICQEAALYFDPYKPEDIKDKIIWGLKDAALRDTLRERSLKRATAFSWEKAAQSMLAIFEQVVQARGTK